MRAIALGRRRGGLAWIVALVLGLGLLSVAIATAVTNHARERDNLDRALTNEARKQSEALDHYFARARSLTQVTANNPAFLDFYEEPGGRREKILERGRTIREANHALAYLEDLFPRSIGEACFIDRGGAENARAVRGRIAPISELSPSERGAPFFKPTFDLKAGEVYQARPYVSPDTHSWVVSNSTPLPVQEGATPAIVHFEISVESFRRQAASTDGRFDVALVEARSGRVVVDSRYPQAAGSDSILGRPQDTRFERFVSTAGRAFRQGTMELGGTPSAYRAIEPSPNNANHWVVVALAKEPATTWIDQVGLSEAVMGALALLLLGYAIFSLRSSHAHLRAEAMTDSLTGLGNRRILLADLEAGLAAASAQRPLLLAIFDLNGFKSYNDTFGHPAGDALLIRLAESLQGSLEGLAVPYRLGGDEFCVLATLEPDRADTVVATAERALSEHGEGFAVTCSHGSIVLPEEADNAGDALRLADQRMYADKKAGRVSAGKQMTDVLLKVLAERSADLGEHVGVVAELTGLVGRELGLSA